MAEQYVPTTEVVRRRASHDAAQFGSLQELDFEAQFYAWLADHDRQVAERAWDEGEAATSEFVDGPDWAPLPLNPYRADPKGSNHG